MKRFFLTALLCAVFCISLPFALNRSLRSETADDTAGKSEAVTDAVAKPPALTGETVPVFSHLTNKTEEMAMEDYITGVVAAEMPAEYEPEALKAQALAAISYARYTLSAGKNAVSTDSGTSQGYWTKEDMQKAWGEDYEQNYQKIRNAVTAVSSLSLEYNGAPILAAYFACSGGQTENAADIWGKEYPYLVSVPSDGDTLSPECESTVTLSARQVYENLNAVKSVAETDSPEDWFSDYRRTEAGGVTHVNFCEKTFTGAEIRTALSLPSTDFSAEYADGSFQFTCKGYGHGVGMSQYGADYLARQGADFAEILLHYYPGAQIVQKPETADIS